MINTIDISAFFHPSEITPVDGQPDEYLMPIYGTDWSVWVRVQGVAERAGYPCLHVTIQEATDWAFGRDGDDRFHVVDTRASEDDDLIDVWLYRSAPLDPVALAAERQSHRIAAFEGQRRFWRRLYWTTFTEECGNGECVFTSISIDVNDLGGIRVRESTEEDESVVVCCDEREAIVIYDEICARYAHREVFETDQTECMG